ncbi:ABC transporter permease [Gemmatimonas groenlandica]|uniref:ABC transporter permease n=1 Tax=Gemmatimonas groenlandica TaxID=2732249 RepID=A0A6M4IMV3_9BACT|nr:ABC transporter permease [Gemmatimonas groenlandica]QJR36023.1 ABC transporter permease [Gemmatimonas groenlandica]
MVLRLLQSVAVVFTAATLAFVLLHLAPGDAATALGEGVSPEVRAALRAQWGLDESLATQYGRWLSSFLRGDLGFSRDQHRPVAAVLGDALPRSLFLMGCALSVSLIGGMLIGAWQGARAGSRRDRTTSTALLVLYSLPEFWLALVLLVVFSYHLGWLPATGITSETYDYMSPFDKLCDRLSHLVLPLVSLSLVGVSVFARYQRDAMQESMTQAFVRTARAKGLTEAGVRRQAWRNALLPVITVTGLMLPALITGAVFVERVFSWPGMGFAMIRAIEARDYQVVSAGVILGSAVTTFGAALADIARDIADPRLRSQ